MFGLNAVILLQLLYHKEVKMFGWIKKRILKSIIKDITKNLPKYKEIALIYIEQHKDEIIEKVKKAIEDIIKNELAKVLNK